LGHCVLTSGRRHQLGSFFQIPGSLFQIPGSFFRLLGSFFQVFGLRLKMLGSFFQKFGLRLKVLGSFFQKFGSRLRVLGSFFQTPGSRLKVLGSFFQTPGLRLKVLGSFFQTPGSFFESASRFPMPASRRIGFERAKTRSAGQTRPASRNLAFLPEAGLGSFFRFPPLRPSRSRPRPARTGFVRAKNPARPIATM